MNRPSPAYPRELLLERSVLLAEHEAERSQLPLVTGALVDPTTTKSHEQGVSLSASGLHAALSIIDTTGFEAGKAADAHGLVNRRSSYTDDHFVRERLFPDPVLYQKLTLDNPTGAPAIVFAFAKDGQSWTLTGMSRATFQASEYIERAPEGGPLQDLETALTASLRNWIARQEEDYEIGFIRDAQHGDFTACSPLRRWADFKNLKLIRDLYIDLDTTSVLSQSSIEIIDQHLAGSYPLIDLESARRILEPDTSPANLELKIQKIIKTRAIEKYPLDNRTFAELCEAILDGEVSASRIVGIATAIGSITTNSMNPNILEVGGVHVRGLSAEEIVIAALQATSRREPKTLQARDALHELESRVRDARAIRESGFGVVEECIRRMYDKRRQGSIRYITK